MARGTECGNFNGAAPSRLTGDVRHPVGHHQRTCGTPVAMKHPSFNHGRVSFDKRMALAETLFQDCDPHTLSEITRRAENLFWLEQSGVQLDGV
jgi:hypothetical protein